MPSNRTSGRHWESTGERTGQTSRQSPKGMLGLVLGAGAALTGLAFWARSQTRDTERANPPAGTIIEVSGIKLHAIAGGTGRPVVFLHGMNTMVQDWRLSLLDQAQKSWRCVAFDRPGYGWSERPGWSRWGPERQAEVLRRATRRMGIERPVLVGHSFGALVALAWALDFPDDVAGLVLIAPYCYPGRIKTPFLAAQGLGALGGLARNTVSPMLGRAAMAKAVERIFAPNPVPDAMALYPADMNLRPSQLRTEAEEFALMVPAARRLAERYPEIRAPVMILTGDRDNVIDPVVHAIKLHRAIPHSALTVVPEMGHMLHHFATPQVLGAINRTWHESDVQMRALAPPAQHPKEKEGEQRGAAG